MYNDLIQRLHRYSENCVAYKLDADFASAVQEASNAIEELLAERDEVNAGSWKTAFKIECDEHRWISVNERLPSNGTKVLVFEFGRVEQAYTTTYTADGSLCWIVINGGSYHRISDANCPIKWWMPLPEPPKEE